MFNTANVAQKSLNLGLFWIPVCVCVLYYYAVSIYNEERHNWCIFQMEVKTMAQICEVASLFVEMDKQAEVLQM